MGVCVILRLETAGYGPIVYCVELVVSLQNPQLFESNLPNREAHNKGR